MHFCEYETEIFYVVLKCFSNLELSLYDNNVFNDVSIAGRRFLFVKIVVCYGLELH